MARRIALREFHQQVLKRLEIVAEAGELRASKLAVEIAGENWLVDLASISEVIPLPPHVPVPLTHAWFLGVANVRGNLYGISDFAAFMGRGPTPSGLENRVLLMHPRFQVNAGLLVRRVFGLRGAEQFEALSGEPGPWALAAWRAQDGGLWKELDVESLARQPEFLDVGPYRRMDVVASAAPG
jgi:twitching motility protein PilI